MYIHKGWLGNRIVSSDIPGLGASQVLYLHAVEDQFWTIQPLVYFTVVQFSFKACDLNYDKMGLGWSGNLQ